MRPLYAAFRYRKKASAERFAANPGPAKNFPSSYPGSPGPEAEATTEFVVGGIAALLDRLEEEDRQQLLQVAMRLGRQ